MRITINTIDSARDYERALAEMSDLVDADPAPGSSAGARMDVLGALLELYEAKHHRIEPPDPIDAILFHLEQSGEDESSLVGLIGSRTRVWEVLHGHRPLSLGMIRALHTRLGIPAESLLGC